MDDSAPWGSGGPAVSPVDVVTPGLSDAPLSQADVGEWTVVSGRRRGKQQRPAYTPRRCDQCRFEGTFPSRTAFRNHLRGAHGLYLGWWIGERQASQDLPADTLRALRELLMRMHHAPVE